MAHQAGAYPGFCSIKWLGILLLPLDGMLVHHRVTPSIKFGSTHLYTWVERGTEKVKCVAQEHNTLAPARARTWTAWSGIKLTKLPDPLQISNMLFCSQCPCNWPEPFHQRDQSSSQMTIAHAIQLTFLNVEYNIHQYNYSLFYKELFTFSCTIPYSNRNRSQNEKLWFLHSGVKLVVAVPKIRFFKPWWLTENSSY